MLHLHAIIIITSIVRLIASHDLTVQLQCKLDCKQIVP